MDVKEKLDQIFYELENRVDTGDITQEFADAVFLEAVIKYCSVDDEEVVEESSKKYRRENENGFVRENKLKKKLGDLKRKSQNELKVMTRMHTQTGKMGKGNAIVTLDEKDYKRLCEVEKKCRKELDFNKYQKHFKELTRLCNTPPGSIAIAYINKKRLENGKYEINTRYSLASKKMRLPEGYSLYHFSNHDVTKLYPTFKGKRMGEDRVPHMNGTGELYSYPRVYFMIRPTENRVTGYNPKKTDVQRHKYVAKTNIREVYAGPNTSPVPYIAGAVYVETLFPIPVEKIS